MSKVRLFENDFLERFSHTHPLVPAILWLPICGLLFTEARRQATLSGTDIVAAAFAGYLLWTLVEYLLHRYIFHFRPEGAFQEKLAFIIHGVHHADPQDGTRLVMPPVPALILSSALYVLLRLIAGPVWISPLFGGFILGYLSYDYMHYSLHHFRMSGPVRLYLKKHHMYHHFFDAKSNWGVSTPLWDWVFRTAKSRGTMKA